MAKRGRPTGSGYKDGKYLDRIADALTRDPSKKPNAAIMAIARKEIDPTGHDAFRRRLHRKWRVQGAERLDEAYERERERRPRSIDRVRAATILPPETIEAINRARGVVALSNEAKDAIRRAREAMMPSKEVTDAISRVSSQIGTVAEQMSAISRAQSVVQSMPELKSALDRLRDLQRQSPAAQLLGVAEMHANHILPSNPNGLSAISGDATASASTNRGEDK